VRARRAAAILSALAGLVGAGAAWPGGATAAPLSDCTRTHGTIVAVDFAHWGGPIVRGCGIDQKSGYNLLHTAGFTTAGDDHDGPAFICRLGDSVFHHGTEYPTPKQDNCILTPPASGYWSFWVAPADQKHWSYSQLGAMSEIPKPGEVELWIFGGTNIAGTKGSGVPDFSPASLRRPAHRTTARTTTTTTTSTPTTSSTTTTHATTTTRPSTTTTTAATPTHSATTTATTTTRASDATGHHRRHREKSRTTHHHPAHRRSHAAAPVRTTSSSTTASTTRAGGEQVVAARPTSQRTSAGSALPVIIGGALALLLVAGAGRAIWQRRREE
jgi:hypothetical protein